MAAIIETTKITTPSSATVGNAILSTIVITNIGDATAIGVIVSDPIPPGVIRTFSSVKTAGVTGNTPSGTTAINDTLTIPAGGSVTYSISDTPTAPGTYQNIVTTSGPGVPPAQLPIPGGPVLTITDTENCCSDTPVNVAVTVPPLAPAPGVSVDGKDCLEVLTPELVNSLVQTIPHPDYVQMVKFCPNDPVLDPEIVCLVPNGSPGGTAPTVGVAVFDTSVLPPVTTYYIGNTNVTATHTQVACSSQDFELVEKCYQLIAAPYSRFTRINVINVNTNAVTSTLWLDESGVVIPAPVPATVELCDQACVTYTEVGYLADPGSADLTFVEKCNVTEVKLDGVVYSVELSPGWTVGQLVAAVNAVAPGSLIQDGNVIKSGTGKVLSNLEIICVSEDFVEPFQTTLTPQYLTLGAGTVNAGATTTYTYINDAGFMGPTDRYTIARVKDLRPACFDMGLGAAAVDAKGDPDGMVLAVNGSPTPGDFYKQTATGLTIGQEYEFKAYVANANGTTAQGCGDAVPANSPDVVLRIETSGGSLIDSVATGPVTYQNTWKSFNIKFVAQQTSVNYILRNNGTAMGGNDILLDHITFGRVSRQRYPLCSRDRVIPVEIVKEVCNGVVTTPVKVFSPDGLIEYTMPDNTGLILATGVPLKCDDKTQVSGAQEGSVYIEQGCANGVPYNRKTIVGTLTDIVTYVDSAGAEVTVAPVGWTLGGCGGATQEIDIVYSNSEEICVTNAGVSTNHLIRQRQTVDNSTGLVTATVTEYSTDGSTWTTVVPTGTITIGKCCCCFDVIKERTCLQIKTPDTVIPGGPVNLVWTNGTANQVNSSYTDENGVVRTLQINRNSGTMLLSATGAFPGALNFGTNSNGNFTLTVSPPYAGGRQFRINAFDLDNTTSANPNTSQEAIGAFAALGPADTYTGTIGFRTSDGGIGGTANNGTGIATWNDVPAFSSLTFDMLGSPGLNSGWNFEPVNRQTVIRGVVTKYTRLTVTNSCTNQETVSYLDENGNAVILTPPQIAQLTECVDTIKVVEEGCLRSLEGEVYTSVEIIKTIQPDGAVTTEYFDVSGNPVFPVSGETISLGACNGSSCDSPFFVEDCTTQYDLALCDQLSETNLTNVIVDQGATVTQLHVFPTAINLQQTISEVSTPAGGGMSGGAGTWSTTNNTTSTVFTSVFDRPFTGKIRLDVSAFSAGEQVSAFSLGTPSALTMTSLGGGAYNGNGFLEWDVVAVSGYNFTFTASVAGRMLFTTTLSDIITVSFNRHFKQNGNGLITTTDFDSVGQPYTVVGTIIACDTETTTSITTTEIDIVYSAAQEVCVTNLGISTTQFVRQRQTVNNATGLVTGTVIEYSTDGSTYSTVVPTGVITAGACAVGTELDIVYGIANEVCVQDTGIFTTWFVRQASVVNNVTGLIVSTVTEFSLDGITYSTTVPTGTISAGKCCFQTNPQLTSTVVRQVGVGTQTITAGARSITVTVITGSPTVNIGATGAVTLAAGVSLTWSTDAGGPSGESLLQAFVFTGVAGSDFIITTTRE